LRLLNRRIISRKICALIQKWVYCRSGATPLYQARPVVIFQSTGGPAFGLVFDNPAYSICKFPADGRGMRYTVKDTELSYFILWR